MSYEILFTDQGLKIIHLTGITFNSLTTWCVQFDDGKEAAVYNSAGIRT
ncbi:hypothetical protein [Mucilaginibacter flavidus]|nr:hypothetical protein [Mucilaginibacter flavidus]